MEEEQGPFEAIGENTIYRFPLTPQAEAALLNVTMDEELSKTDAMNRAINVYAELVRQRKLGRDVEFVETKATRTWSGLWFGTTRRWSFSWK